MAVRFTKDHFHQMIKEVQTKPITQSETLAFILDVTVRAKIQYLCSINHSIRGLQIEEDAFQETFLKVCSKLVTDFLYRADKSGLNDDHEGFAAWLLAVASSTVSDVAAETLYREETKKEREEKTKTELDPFEVAEGQKNDISRLEMAIESVVNGKYAIHKVITWLGICSLMLVSNESKIYSTHRLEERAGYSLKTVYETILGETNYIPWLKITDAQHAKIRSGLAELNADGVPYGSLPLHSFFMKGRDGKPDGLKSISDWVSHINSNLKKEFELEK